MATFEIGKPVETTVPTVEVTVDINNPLPVGVHRFQLVVEDDSGNKSTPSEVDVIVRDTINPTAVLDPIGPIEAGNSFNLSGARSSDVAPGQVVKYTWTMVNVPERPVLSGLDGAVLTDRLVTDITRG